MKIIDVIVGGFFPARMPGGEEVRIKNNLKLFGRMPLNYRGCVWSG